ncbi:crotonase/enoyl-CoA hydratase family protein [Lacinutrix undariae]
MTDLVQYTTEDNYAIITINNGKANALSNDVILAISNALDKAKHENKVVILTGQPGIFSGGFDLNIMKKGSKSAKTLVTAGSKLALKMSSFPLPIISACNGHAIAKGAFLLLSSDYRIGAEGKFKIGLNEVMIGMTMHHVGIAIAKHKLAPVYFERAVNNAEIFLSADAVTAGFLDVVVPEDQVLPTAIKTAKLFSQLNLKAHAATKLRVRKNYLKTLEKAIKKDKSGKIAINA